MFNTSKDKIELKRKYYNKISCLRKKAEELDPMLFDKHINDFYQYQIDKIFEIQTKFNNAQANINISFMKNKEHIFKNLIVKIINAIRVREEPNFRTMQEKADLASALCGIIQARPDSGAEKSLWILFAVYYNLDLFHQKGITWENLYNISYRANHACFDLFLSHLKDNTYSELTQALGYDAIALIGSEHKIVKKKVNDCYQTFKNIINNNNMCNELFKNINVLSNITELHLKKQNIGAFIKYRDLIFRHHRISKNYILLDIITFINKCDFISIEEKNNILSTFSNEQPLLTSEQSGVINMNQNKKGKYIHSTQLTGANNAINNSNYLPIYRSNNIVNHNYLSMQQSRDMSFMSQRHGAINMVNMNNYLPIQPPRPVSLTPQQFYSRNMVNMNNYLPIQPSWPVSLTPQQFYLRNMDNMNNYLPIQPTRPESLERQQFYYINNKTTNNYNNYNAISMQSTMHTSLTPEQFIHVNKRKRNRPA